MEVTLAPGKGSIRVARMSPPAIGSGIVTARPAVFYGFAIWGNGEWPAGNISLDIRDGTGPQGNRLFPGNFEIDGDDEGAFEYVTPVNCPNGIYVRIQGAGAGVATWQIKYDDGSV